MLTHFSLTKLKPSKYWRVLTGMLTDHPYFGNERMSNPSKHCLCTTLSSDFCHSACTFKKFNKRVRHLDDLNRQIDTLLDSSWPQSEEIDALSSRLQQNRIFPAIKRKLLMSRLLPYETGRGPLLNQKTTLMGTSMLDQAGGKESAEAMTLRKLRALSSKIVFKMIATPDSVPLCKEEVEAISVHLNSRFERALSTLSKMSGSLASRTNPVVAR